MLNYDLADVLAELGIDTSGGEFFFPEKKVIDDTTRANILVQLKSSFNLPVGDDFLYETFGIDKPEDYDGIKQRIREEQERQRLPKESEGNPEDEPEDADPDKKSFKDRFRSFFGIAPQDGAASDW